MKKIYYVLYSVCLILLTTILVYAKVDDYKLSGKRVIIDVGHGGLDVGTIYHDIYEKDINLGIALKLKEELSKEGVTVYITRDGDYDLASPNAKRRKKSDFDNRIKYINESNADFYVSIHINYLDNSKYSGGQVFYLDDSYDLAVSIQESFNKELKSNREVKKMSNTYYMYRQLNIPGVLIECGFLSNSTEREKLITESYQEEIAKTIVKGIINYY